MTDYGKRKFLKSLMVIPALSAFNISNQQLSPVWEKRGGAKGRNLKISLNAYSFNEPLSKGSMNLHNLLDFCATHNFDAADLTGYYFPGYPEVPPDEYLYSIKRKAFELGLEISGTGVRNDFSLPDEGKRKEDVALVKNWIECAEKLGAPVIRIFSGLEIPDGYSWEQVAEWMMDDINECVEYGKNHGVMVAIQNHDDFIQTAEQVKTMMDMVDSEWFGLILDTGSYGTKDPYQEISDSIPYAVSWQIKEKILNRGVEEDINLKKLMEIIKASDYRGYLPIETLGPGNPFTKVPAFLEKVRNAMS